MSRSIIMSGAALFALLLTGCQFHARDAEAYRKVTRDALESRNGDMKACYDKELERDPTLSGTVVVNFIVEKDTGVIKNFKLDKKASNANKHLRLCVLRALEGEALKIDPPDAREGHATFHWSFQAGQS